MQPMPTTLAANLWPVSTTLEANLPPISTSPAANFATGTAGVVDICGKFGTGVNHTGNKLATGVNNPSDKFWEQYQTAELEGKNYLFVNSTSQRCPDKISKVFLIEGFYFLYLPPVSTIGVVHQVELRISLRIFQKIRNTTNRILSCLR